MGSEWVLSWGVSGCCHGEWVGVVMGSEWVLSWGVSGCCHGE